MVMNVRGGGLMVAEWITELAARGGATLVSAAATDAWAVARSGIARLFGRGDARREKTTEGRLDDTAIALTQGDPSTREAMLRAQAAVWATRLSDLLEEHPELKEDLARLTGQVRTQLPAAWQQWVQAIATGAVTQTSTGGMSRSEEHTSELQSLR